MSTTAHEPFLSEQSVQTIRDYQITHGSLLLRPPYSTPQTIAYPIGVSAKPTAFPELLFKQAVGLQRLVNKLYASVAGDENWLRDTLGYKPTSIENGDEEDSGMYMVRRLWEVYDAVQTEETRWEKQAVSMGVFRADYMLHLPHAPNTDGQVTLKQVEVNTYSVAGAVHAKRVADMHRYLLTSGAYDPAGFSLDQLPDCDNIERIADALAHACLVYQSQKKKDDSPGPMAVLMVVQPNNVNICDERPIEYALAARSIRVYRVEWGAPVLACTVLGPAGELLFHRAPFDQDNPTALSRAAEIAVVYHRAGYAPEEYDLDGGECRYRLECSRAIKCPSILGHLATMKAVQQRLTQRDALIHFLKDEEDVQTMQEFFMRMFKLSEATEDRLAALADPVQAREYVLKPNLEGGGHNIFGEAIPPFLDTLPREHWQEYVGMQMIHPPETKSHLLTTKHGLWYGSVVSELGVLGTCMWRVGDENNVNIMSNEQAGYTFKTKRREVQEMSVVKGYGCFDSPMLTS